MLKGRENQKKTEFLKKKQRSEGQTLIKTREIVLDSPSFLPFSPCEDCFSFCKRTYPCAQSLMLSFCQPESVPLCSSIDHIPWPGGESCLCLCQYYLQWLVIWPVSLEVALIWKDTSSLMRHSHRGTFFFSTNSQTLRDRPQLNMGSLSKMEEPSLYTFNV